MSSLDRLALSTYQLPWLRSDMEAAAEFIYAVKTDRLCDIDKVVHRIDQLLVMSGLQLSHKVPPKEDSWNAALTEQMLAHLKDVVETQNTNCRGGCEESSVRRWMQLLIPAGAEYVRTSENLRSLPHARKHGMNI